jgi:hypothetical protein
MAQTFTQTTRCTLCQHEALQEITTPESVPLIEGEPPPPVAPTVVYLTPPCDCEAWGPGVEPVRRARREPPGRQVRWGAPRSSPEEST